MKIEYSTTYYVHVPSLLIVGKASIQMQIQRAHVHFLKPRIEREYIKIQHGSVLESICSWSLNGHINLIALNQSSKRICLTRWLCTPRLFKESNMLAFDNVLITHSSNLVNLLFKCHCKWKQVLVAFTVTTSGPMLPNGLQQTLSLGHPLFLGYETHE